MKKSLRKEILKKRKILDEQNWIKSSMGIQYRLLETLFYQNASSILVYCHFDREVKTDLLIEDALKRKKVVCVPFNDWETKTFVPSRIYSLKDVDRKGNKVPQPFTREVFPAEKIDMAVIPGVVFDVYGNRIGTGKGFFDRFFLEYGNSILKVAFAFDFQVLEEKLPVEGWDKKVDIIITETRIIKIHECR